MKMRQLVAGALAAVTMLGGMAFTATANAATPSTITLKGDLSAGNTYTAYRIASYTDVQGTAPLASSVSLATVDAWNDAIADAVPDAKKPIPAHFAGNVAAYVASWSTTADGAALRQFAASLAQRIPAGQTGVDNTGDTIAVDDEGLYLVTDSKGQALIVGTRITGASGVYTQLGAAGAAQTLGAVVVKPEALPTPNKKVLDAAGNEVNDPSALVGQYVTFEVTTQVPNTVGYDSYDFTIEDTPSAGLKLADDDAHPIAVTVGGQAAPAGSYTAKVENNVLTVDFDAVRFVGFDAGAEIRVTYAAQVTKDAIAGNGAVNKVVAKHDGTTSGFGQVTVHTGSYAFTKVAGDTGKGLQGAVFKIQRKGGAWLSQGAGTKAWTEAADQDEATGFVSGADGRVAFEGLADGTYAVEETTVPNGYYAATPVRFEFTVTGGQVTGKADTNLGLFDPAADQARNINSVTQLPVTGAAGTALFTLIGLLLAGAAATVALRSRGASRRALTA